MVDESPSPREMTERVRKHIYWTHGTMMFLIFTGGAWLMSAAYAIFGFDALAFLNHGAKNDRAFNNIAYWVLAIAAPIGSAIFAWVRIKRALYLAQHGVEVAAKVTSVGMPVRGWCRVNYEFSVGGHAIITGLRSMISDIAKQYRDGSKPLLLIVDANNPKRTMLKVQVFPDAPP